MAFIDNPAKLMHESGLLTELNRKVLHPLGFSLAISEEETGEPYACSCGQTHPPFQPGFNLEQVDDPEGIEYLQETLESARVRLRAYSEANGVAARLRARQDKLGFIIQPQAIVLQDAADDLPPAAAEISVKLADGRVFTVACASAAPTAIRAGMTDLQIQLEQMNPEAASG